MDQIPNQIKNLVFFYTFDILLTVLLPSYLTWKQKLIFKKSVKIAVFVNIKHSEISISILSLLNSEDNEVTEVLTQSCGDSFRDGSTLYDPMEAFKAPPPPPNFCPHDLILELHYCVLGTFPQKSLTLCGSRLGVKF